MECNCRRSSSTLIAATLLLLQANGLLIGANDLWIAAAGLAYGVPVVTRNAEHFVRVPGLRVQSYPEGSEASR